MRRDAARDNVEARVCEREILGERRRVGLHAGRGIDGDDGGSTLAQPPCDVPAARRDVERRDTRRRLAPLDHEVEICAFRVRRALAVVVGAVAPEVHHFASSTARRAPSSIVASG